MPPQQSDRLLDLIDQVLHFGAHGSASKRSWRSLPAGCSDCARATQWVAIPRNRAHDGRHGTASICRRYRGENALQANRLFTSLPQFFS
jgi:hypothetical protein